MDDVFKNSILIVDDEKFNLEVLCSILTPEFTVYLTKNGSSAINMAQKYAPDLIMLDIIMPEMSGYEVLSALKASEITRNIPIIFITGLNKVEDEETGLGLAAVDFIHKPFSTRIVQLKIRNHMQGIRRMREMEIANNAKSALLAKLDSEARKPLSAVLSIAESQLQKGSLQQEAKEAFSEILQSGSALLELINDISRESMSADNIIKVPKIQ